MPHDIIPEVFVEAAKRHGLDSEPDHEAGDLQDFLRVAHKLLTPEQKQAFFDTREVGIALRACKTTIMADPRDLTGEDFIEAAENAGKETPDETYALREFLSRSIGLLDGDQRQALIDDATVQDRLSSALGLEGENGTDIYIAAAAEVVEVAPPTM